VQLEGLVVSPEEKLQNERAGNSELRVVNS
jgi:hypothetical protein